jgi:CubicO group peptidase (beta-lactamase class C family)
MPRRSFGILYREFLFRVVDRELLSTYGTGDAHRILAQIAAMLVLFGCAISIPAVDRNVEFSNPVRVFLAWRFEHFLIATTMLAVGLLAVLSWDSMFPTHRDLLVLAPLPVRARTILLAKLAALASALGLAVVALHVVAGVIWPLALNRAAPPAAMPNLTRTAALPPGGVGDLAAALDRDLAGVRDHGWLASGAGGALSIAVSRHGVRRVWTYGVARPDSLFQIGSITKTFTALALARMVQDGRVRLNTPVRELIPEAGIPGPGASGTPEITLEDLATHRSGLPMMPPGIVPQRERSPFIGYHADDLYVYLRRHGLGRPAETAFAYSNLGFGLLGHALARHAQTDYPTLIRRLVTQPLGLADTGALPPGQQRRVMQGYDEEGRPVEAWAFDEIFAGAGAMYSTAPDLLAWLEANLHPEGALAAPLELTQQRRRVARGATSIGLAWMIDDRSGEIRHDGAVAGFTAAAFFDPGHDVAAVVLTNRGPGVSAPASIVLDEIRARLSGVAAPAQDEVVVPARGGVRSWLRITFAYWTTMVAASLFIVALLIGVQGLALAVLPRRYFLRVSPLLQLTAFAALVGVYLLQPIGFISDDLVAAQSDGLLAASPSYWFLGLFQSLSGSQAMPLLAARAWVGLGAALSVAALAYAVSYAQTLRGIAEEPAVTPAPGSRRLVLRSHGPVSSLSVFALRTLFRSGTPRVVMAFYWGLGFAFAVGFIKSPRGQQFATAVESGTWYDTSLPLLVASILMMGAAVIAARNAFAIPQDPAANWIFRMVPLRDGRSYGAARRRALLAVSVLPVCAMSAVAFFSIWPWGPALRHTLALALFGTVLVEIADGNSRRIPFTCSYLPGKSQLHIRALVVVLIGIPLVVNAASFEREALRGGVRYALMLAVLAATLAALKWSSGWLPTAEMPDFEDEPDDRVPTLELWDCLPAMVGAQEAGSIPSPAPRRP